MRAVGFGRHFQIVATTGYRAVISLLADSNLRDSLYPGEAGYRDCKVIHLFPTSCRPVDLTSPADVTLNVRHLRTVASTI